MQNGRRGGVEVQRQTESCASERQKELKKKNQSKNQKKGPEKTEKPAERERKREKEVEQQQWREEEGRQEKDTKELADGFRRHQEINLFLMFYKYVIKEIRVTFSFHGVLITSAVHHLVAILSIALKQQQVEMKFPKPLNICYFVFLEVQKHVTPNFCIK